MNKYKWWNEAQDFDEDIVWYICKHCHAAGDNSTQAVVHHENCPRPTPSRGHPDQHGHTVTIGPYGEWIIEDELDITSYDDTLS